MFVRRLIVTSKDDGVEAGFAPQLHEVNHIAKAQRWVTSENHTRLTELAAEVSVNTGVVLQLVGLDQLKETGSVQQEPTVQHTEQPDCRRQSSRLTSA